jgi:hypothetical protein
MKTFAIDEALAVSAVFALLSFQAGPASAQTEIPIKFDASGCPVDDSVPDVGTRRGKTIIWQAVDEDSVQTTEAFKIYFDPLQGPTLRAPQGKVSRAIDADAPKVDYKYTIVGDRCEDDPEDPNIRVD